VTIPLIPALAATDNLSTISAQTVNDWRTYLARCLDGVGGSDGIAATPSTPILLNGNALQLGDQLLYTARDVVRNHSMIVNGISANWSLSPTYRGAWRNTADGGVLHVLMDRMVHGSTLTRLTVRWIGAVGHAAFPGGAPTMPHWELYAVDNAGASTLVATATDTSATHTAYETAHSISNSAIAHTVTLDTHRYVLEMTGESAPNFFANANIIQVFTTHSVTEQSEG
jgi:hypothetical protein